ncbi:MAG: hypothetical protein EGR51_00315 [Oscillibacter sp.]|nr:hypothetical protein [Oscillibacter sp.]
MKKFLALILTLAMALSVTACGGSDDTADDTADGEGSGTEETADYASMTDDELKAAITTVEGGKLTVATSPDFAPYEFYAIDENGDPQLAGFDMDLAQYIADYLGLSLEIVPMDFDGTIMELQNGNVDLGMAGYSPDPKRADSMDFSDIYITGGQSFVCVESNKDLFTSLEDANNADYQIGAQVGSIQADLAHENTPDADIIELAKVPDIIAELVTGKLDGAFIETMVAESYATQYPELCLVLEVPYDAEGSVVGVTKGNAALLEGVKSVRLFGEEIAVHAQIVNFQGLSSHADRNHLLSWIQAIQAPKPQHVFVVHGDREVAPFFAKTIQGLGFTAHAPQYTEVYDLIADKVTEPGYLPERKARTTGGMRASAAYERLVAVGNMLMESIKRSRGRDNKSLARFADQLRQLLEKWES